jgi:hypothetical protein
MTTKTLFLDFDGVLHSSSSYEDQPFCRLPLLQDLIINEAVDIVISSSWRFHHKLDDLKFFLGELGNKVVGKTGDAHIGRYPRFNEIKTYVDGHDIEDWRALDDAFYEFPPHDHRVIICDPEKGIETSQVQELNEWLRLYSCKQTTS